MLLVAGLQALTEAPRGLALALAVFELVSSALLLLNVGKSVHANRHLLHRSPEDHPSHAAHQGIEWADIFAAAVVVAEALEHRMHGGHHLSRPAILAAATLLVLGLFHGRILHAAEQRRALKVSDTGISIGGRPFKQRKVRASWSELKSIEIGERRATIITKAGRRRTLDLADLEGAEHVRAALTTARARLAASQESSADQVP